MDPIPSILEILYGISWFLISPTLITVLAGAGTARILPRIYVTRWGTPGTHPGFPNHGPQHRRLHPHR